MAKPTHARTSAASIPRTHAISAAVLADAIDVLAQLLALSKGARALLERRETDATGRTDADAAGHVLAMIETNADHLLDELITAEGAFFPSAPTANARRMGAAA